MTEVEFFFHSPRLFGDDLLLARQIQVLAQAWRKLPRHQASATFNPCMSIRNSVFCQMEGSGTRVKNLLDFLT
jgi:hypothetical protein